MKFALAATAGVAIMVALSASAYVVPAGGGKLPKIPTHAHSSVKRNGESIRLPLTHKRRGDMDTPEGLVKFAQRQKGYVEHKFGSRDGHPAKRQDAALTGVGPDSFYVATVTVGTPAQDFDLVLDTGSSDLWLASSSCTQAICTSVTRYDESQSSTSVSSTTPFDITYGSGGASGTLFADTVSLAGYTVFNTTFGDVTDLETGTVYEPTSGIMGMGFQSLATSGATPFWEVLTKSNVLSANAFTFQLARNNDAASSTTLSPGGIFTLGEIDAAQYTGDITYIDIPNTTVGSRGYWSIYMDSVTVAGNTISTTDEYAVIDTGTTLIAGPATEVASIYAGISGAQTVTDSDGTATGYYAIPCTSSVSISFTFGGREFAMESSDFNAGAVGSGYCLGAIFEADLSSAGLSWIIGDAFLKNVFTVFDSSPPRVGFASLVDGTAQELSTTENAATEDVEDAVTTAIPIPTATTAAGGATNTGIVGGSGLPVPVASAGVSAATSTPSSSTATSSAASNLLKSGIFGLLVSSSCAVVVGSLLLV